MTTLDMTISNFSTEGRSFESKGGKDTSHLTLVGTITVDHMQADANLTIFTESWSNEPEIGGMTAQFDNGNATLTIQKKVTRGLFNQLAADLARAKVASCTITHDGGPVVWPASTGTLPPKAVNGIAVRTGSHSL